MKTSASGLAFVFLHEVNPLERKNAVFRAFLDTIASPPVWTIGVGHTSAAGPPAVGEGLVFTRDQALQVLASDLRLVETRVGSRLGVVPQNVFDAAVSFDFNTGGIFTATWPVFYLKGDLASAQVWFLKWTTAGGKVIQGLVNRRNDEWRLLASGSYGDLSEVSVVVPTPEPRPAAPGAPTAVPAPSPTVPAPAAGSGLWALIQQFLTAIFGS